MSRTPPYLTAAAACAQIAAQELCRHIPDLPDCDGQLPMFDAPLPARPNAPRPRPAPRPAIKHLTQRRIDHYMRVLMAKYLTRVLGQPLTYVATVLGCNVGVASRLAKTCLPNELDGGKDQVARNVIMDENGMTEVEHPTSRFNRWRGAGETH